ncbi:septation regulator SpoVG [Candidatus Dependentiae bacterium]|nr:septation regulator SpoVG [Candidatus Dependentiae bacterium]
MKITEVKVYPAKDSGRLKAYATVVFDSSFIVRDLKVIEGNKGYFVSMPSRRRKDGTFRDIVHPLNSEMRKTIERVIVDEYKRVLEFGGAAGQSDGDAPDYDDAE